MGSTTISSRVMTAAGSRTPPCSRTGWSASGGNPGSGFRGMEVDQVATDLPYGYSHGLQRLAGSPAHR